MQQIKTLIDIRVGGYHEDCITHSVETIPAGTILKLSHVDSNDIVWAFLPAPFQATAQVDFNRFEVVGV